MFKQAKCEECGQQMTYSTECYKVKPTLCTLCEIENGKEKRHDKNSK